MSPSLALSLVCVLAAPQSFSDAWYTETFVGDVPAALEQYTRLFDVPDEDVPVETRRKAAFRAGVCAEKLGDLRRARIAYSWFRMNGARNDTWTQRALLRLAELERSAKPSRTGDDELDVRLPDRALAGDEAAELIGAAAERNRRRLAVAASLAELVERRRELLERDRRLARRFRRVGVSFDRLPGRGVDFPSPDWESFVRELDLDPADRGLLTGALIDLCFLEGLRSTQTLSLGRAVRALDAQLELAEGEDDWRAREARDMLDLLERALGMLEGARTRAERLIESSVERREAEAAARMTNALDAARGLVDEDRLREAADSLVDVFLHEDWAPPGARRSGELREVAIAALHQCRLIAPTVDWGVTRLGGAAAESILLDTAELVTTSLDVPGATPGAMRLPAPRLVSPRSALARLRREVIETIDSAERHRATEPGAETDGPGPEDRRATPSNVVLADTLTILEWFPSLDDTGGQLRRRLERLMR